MPSSTWSTTSTSGCATWARAWPATSRPKSAIGAVVYDDQGRILLVQRADSGVWLYPTGWADVGYSPAEVAVKEVLEETGIHCEPRGRHRRARRHAHGHDPHPALLHGVPLPGHRRRAAPPTRWRRSDVGWFAEDELPAMTVGVCAVGRPRLRGDPRASRCPCCSTRRAPSPGTAPSPTRPVGRGRLLVAQEALDLFGDRLGAGEDAGLLVVALLEARPRRWRSPRRRRPARSPGARRTRTRSRGRWWGPTSGASPRRARSSARAAFGDGAPGT